MTINVFPTCQFMKSTIAIGLAACWLATTAMAATEPAIIPQPQTMERAEGAFKLTPDLVIATDAVSKDTGKFLAERLRKATGYKIKTTSRKKPVKRAEAKQPFSPNIFRRRWCKSTRMSMAGASSSRRVAVCSTTRSV